LSEAAGNLEVGRGLVNALIVEHRPNKGIIFNRYICWLVVWNMFYFFIYWEFHHPN